MLARKAATMADVACAIGEARLKIENGVIYTRRGYPKAVWRAAGLELVYPPKRPERPYQRAGFSHNGGNFRCLVHRIVWWANGNTIPDKFEINHIDGDKLNNLLSNLEAISREANNAHAAATGLTVHPTGRGQASRAKLSDDEVRSIRKLLKEGHSRLELAARFKIDPSQISRIKHNRIYRYVQD